MNDKGSASVLSTPQVDAGDFYFTPTCLTGANGSITLVIHNSGRILHNFSVISQNIDTDIPPGQTVTVKVSVSDKPVPFFCKYHRDAGQQGVLLPGT